MSDKNKIFDYEVPVYSDLLDPKRKNVKIPGFNFDVNTFENLIDNFVLASDIPVILNTSVAQLDRVCTICYNMNFDETYKRLSGISRYWGNRTVKNLANAGHAGAFSVFAKNFLGLSDEDKSANVNITFVNDVNKEEQ